MEIREPVILDAAAASQLKAFIERSEKVAEDEEDTALGLRLSVVGGGCAGFQYRLQIDHAKEGDLVFASEGQNVIVDSVSINFVEGSTVVYHDTLDQQGFEVLNPRAQSACGCGSSFAYTG